MTDIRAKVKLVSDFKMMLKEKLFETWNYEEEEVGSSSDG